MDDFRPGLEGVVAFETEIAEPDKEGSALRYRGVDIEDLVGHYPFEKVWGLLVDESFEPGMPLPERIELQEPSGSGMADLQAGVAAGMAAECAPLGAAVVGGDMVAAAPDSGAVVLSVTALGDLAGRAPVLRSGARPGDVVALAGRLGWSACGLAVLRRGFTSPAAAVTAHRRPLPPYAAGPAAALAGATAMCDVSDGLLADAGHLAEDSGVVLDLDRAALVRACLEPPGPLQQVASALGEDPMAWVLTGGEDHALLATFPPEAVLPEGWTAIGAVSAGPAGVRGSGEAAAAAGRSAGGGGNRPVPLSLGGRPRRRRRR